MKTVGLGKRFPFAKLWCRHNSRRMNECTRNNEWVRDNECIRNNECLLNNECMRKMYLNDLSTCNIT